MEADVFGELCGEVDLIGCEVDMAGEEDEVVVRVALAGAEEGGGVFAIVQVEWMSDERLGRCGGAVLVEG